MINLVLFGPPGAGKGTQAESIIEKFNLTHLSTGDILRSEIAEGTALGLEAKKRMDKGEFVSDEIVILMIKSKIDATKNSAGFIFDGFPRTVAQAEALDSMLNEKKTPISAMIALEVEKDELIKRLLERGKTSGRSDDSDISVIENRIQIYNEKTFPLISYYEKQKKYIPIIGVGSIAEIGLRIEDAIYSIG